MVEAIANSEDVNSNNDNNNDRNSWQMFFKIGVPKSFVNFTGKHL